MDGRAGMTFNQWLLSHDEFKGDIKLGCGVIGWYDGARSLAPSAILPFATSFRGVIIIFIASWDIGIDSDVVCRALIGMT